MNKKKKSYRSTKGREKNCEVSVLTLRCGMAYEERNVERAGLEDADVKRIYDKGRERVEIRNRKGKDWRK